MASFTDQIMQFRPYVQQLPLEAMAQVGMYKQQKYEEGVQKIQSEIDRIAGLDIVKDVDRQYLQSKLNELGSRLKTVAAGDFSNFQLVNSVGGMATQVGRDKNVQNAVQSTASYRKQVQKMNEDSEKTGGSNAYNKDIFLQDVNKWMNDKSVGSSFGYEYTPHRDVYKKLGEIAKNVGVDSQTMQQLFQTDANGNPVLINGKLQYNDVMAETLLKGKDKNKILTAFQAGLDSGDYKQLGINGRYELKGKSTEELHALVDENLSTYERNIILQKEKINDNILKIKNSKDAATPEAVSALGKLNESLLFLDESLKKKIQNTEKLKEADPDAIRSSLYTSNFLESAAEGFTEKETYTKYSKNPAVEMLLDKERLKLEKEKESRQWAEFAYRKQYDAAQMEYSRWSELFKAGLVDEYGRPTGASKDASGARDLPIPDANKATYFTDQFENALNADTDAQRALFEKVAVAHWMATNSGKVDPATGKPYTVDGMKRQMQKYASKLGMSYNDYIVVQGKKTANIYATTGTSPIGNEYIQDFRAISGLEKVITNKVAQLKNADAYIAQNAVDFKPFDLKKAKVDPVTVTVQYKTGMSGGTPILSKPTNYTIPKEDLYKFALANKVQGGFLGRAFTSKSVKDEGDSALAYLQQKYGVEQTNAIAAKLAVGPTPNLGIEDIFYARNKTMQNLVDNEDYRKTIALKEQYFKSIGSAAVPKGYVLYKDKPEQARNLASKLSSVASDYAGIDADYQNIAALANDEKSQFQVNVDPATSRYDKNKYQLQVTDAGGKVTLKPITEDQFKYLTGKNAPTLSASDIDVNIKAFGTGSTNSAYNYMDKDAYSTAYLQSSDFPNTNRFKVAADFAPGGNGRYFPKLYIQRGDDWNLVQYNPGPGFEGFTKKDVENFPSLVDDIFINSLLRRK